jgi:K+-transporting ATPase ATPase A chain
MAKVFQGERTWLHKPLSGLERGIYSVVGVKPTEEMSWKAYAAAFMMFQVMGILFVMLIQMIQAHLPWNPQGLGNVSWHSAFNTAVSFVTNTNWQGYAGETTMSNLTQMAALSVQNFVSAASGLAVAIVLIRGITRKSSGP